jgi:hypothetical protein
MIIGKSDTKIMAKIANVKFFLIIGMFPKKYPASENRVTQRIFPKMLKEKKRRYLIVPTPATNGANVRMIGMNRAIMSVFPPCFS